MSLFPAYGDSSSASGGKISKRRRTKEDGKRVESPEPMFSIDKKGSKDNDLVNIESSDDCADDVEKDYKPEAGEIPEKKSKKKSKKSREHKNRSEKKRNRSRSRSRSRSRQREYSRNNYDNNQSSSRYNHHNQRRQDNRVDYDDRYGYEQDRYRDRDNWGRDQGRDRWRKNQHKQQEEYRLRVSQQFPKKVFSEEVDLQPEYAFRLDANSTPNNLSFRSLSMYQTPRYYPENRNVLGATTDDLDKIFRFQPKFRCLPPPGIDNPDNLSESKDEPPTISKKRKKSTDKETVVPTVKFISFTTKNTQQPSKSNDRFDLNRDFESFSFSGNRGEMSIKDKIEYYNTQVRKEPKNIKLWKEFVQFQDHVFEESDQIFDSAEYSGKKKGDKKRSRKALVEKKIAILEKAIESNPKTLELHMDRMEYLYEIYKPRFVLTEWKKLVTTYQQISSFWIEYLRFTCTQLQLFSYESVIDVFSKCFQKFKQMLNPNYSNFQRPEKFLLLMSDIFLALTLILKNAGFMERAIGLHQAQLEMDFDCPMELLKDKSKQNWTEISKLFEIFWDAGTLRFGEPGAQGWSDWVKHKSNPKTIIGVPDNKVTELEDQFFESVIDSDLESKSSKVDSWLFVESSRSKLFWAPWRVSCSDVDDCEDSQRVVLSSDLTSFVFAIPSVSYISEYETQTAYFRHVVNFLTLLKEDFIPSTHCVDSLMSSFVSISMSDCQSLFNEVFYWQKYLDLYHPCNTDLENSIPEGFILSQLTVPNHINTKSSKKLLLEPRQYSDEIIGLKEEILEENSSKYDELIRNVVEAGIKKLDQSFASLLMEMYLRYEQKSSRYLQKNHKSRVKFAKSLLKEEKLRNSTSLYREVAVLEYFNGNRSKAIELLLKTANTSSRVFEGQEIDVESNWEEACELTRLYRQLAEFYLLDNEKLALKIVASIGNNFSSIDVENSDSEDSKPTRNFLMKAKRRFELVLSALLTDQGNQDPVVCNRYDGDKCIDFLLQKSNFIAEWTCAYGLFEFLFKGFEKAGDVFNMVLNKLPITEPLSRSTKYNSVVVNLHHIREQIYITWCKIGARALSQNLMINSKFRQVLGKALTEFPSSPPLLLIFTDVEKQSSIAGKLWRLMVSIVKQESPTACIRWAPLLMGFGLARRLEEIERDEEIGLDAFGLGGPAVPLDTIFYKLDSLLCAAETNIATRNCPLIWRVHLKLLAMRASQGKDVKRLRALQYDAVRHCPSLKLLYLDGVNYIPDMLQEMNDLMTEKQLLIRLPLQELDVLLELEDKPLDIKEIVVKEVETEIIEEPVNIVPEEVEISEGEVSD